jgi:hypothetical protein
MKTKLFIFLFVAVLIGCEDEDTPNAGGCVQVKLVKTLCGQAILEILDPDYFHKGQSWVDGSGEEYRNVFSTLFPCDFNETLNPGDEFIIRFTDKAAEENCARCKALLPGPEKFSFITHCLPTCGLE